MLSKCGNCVTQKKDSIFTFPQVPHDRKILFMANVVLLAHLLCKMTERRNQIGLDRLLYDNRRHFERMAKFFDKHLTAVQRVVTGVLIDKTAYDRKAKWS